MAVLIAALETATEQVSVALGNHDGVLGLVEVGRGRRHAETLAPSVEFLCRHTGVTLAQVSLIGVDVGPGLFTGMRVGLATARALAGALDVPVVGVSSLDVLAAPWGGEERLVVSVIDARRGEVFWAFHRSTPNGQVRVAGPAVGRVDDLVAAMLARGEPTLCVGDGALRYRGQIEAGVRTDFAGPEWAHPSAARLLGLARAGLAREEHVAPSGLEPLYLRPPDAQINWQTRPGAPA